MTTLIGTNPDQVPVNSMLGGLAYQDPDSVSVKDLTSSGTSNINSLIASTASVTNLSYSGTFTGGTGVLNIGSNQIYKDTSGNVSLGGTGALKLNEGTTAQRPSPPAEGMLRKNSTLNMLEFYSDGVWKNLSSPVGRNLLINGGFDVLQRLVNDSPFIQSTTIGLGTGLERPLFDRWILESTSSGAFNVSVASAKQYGLNVPGIDRMAVLRKVGAGSQTCMLSQRIENGHNFQFINGQTFTLSFWAKSSAASDWIVLEIFEPNATNNTWSSVATTTNTTSIFSSNAATTTSWQRYSFTFDTASVNGARGMMVTFYHISSVDAEELYIAGVQLEEGAYSTNYEIKSKEQILKECERYFCTFSSAVGTCLSANTALVSYQFRTPMRATPNTIAGQNIYWWSGASANVASPSVGDITGNGNRFGGAVGYSAGTGPWGGFTTGAALVLSGTQIIKFEAEL